MKLEKLEYVGTGKLYSTLTEELTNYHLIFNDGEKNVVLCEHEKNPNILRDPNVWMVLQGNEKEIPSDKICPICIKNAEDLVELLKTMVDSSGEK